ncbi:hypothetical protein GUITHDRAFT_149898 [Guillardia theta CCMP2712]|uniref:Ataxin-10 domain-containing protein n=1 Tax=Guillardia theta (strain CCMP2712) TaxID=905079 RepID=L1K366_GUITC|nr:hypothetical protein GUITHDRAFT_149898 [Guillardia theta CCMP2712]EKX54895.1 hypothetical protein GUITHDRAFT_149898 [Guillardia theta CCMP2712]|eukprot:XP_005841875.1 hypothetical protein GUITHDRAFT_149898 [Guillardia theta CCMP2712]
MHVVASSLGFASSSIRKCYRDKGLLRSCINLLKSLSHAQALKTEMGLKCDVIRILANMCYRDRESQDMVRELGGIPLILQASNMDENNPFSREWSILAVRNLCEGNEANQEIIAGIKPKEVASIPQELKDKGMQVELDKSTGKVKLVRDGAGPTGTGGATPSRLQDTDNSTRTMVEELKNMGLRANMDEDTGLVDISHPDAKPSTSVYHPTI